MIYGVGIDSVSVNRIKKSLNNKLFLLKVFGEQERYELELKNYKPEHVAACFCAKEAFSKAIGTGLKGFKLNEVEMLHEPNGKPYLEFSENLKEIYNDNNFKFNISVTHTKDIATVIVICEKI